MVVSDSQLEDNMVDHLRDQNAQVLVQKDRNTEFELCLEAQVVSINSYENIAWSLILNLQDYSKIKAQYLMSMIS